MFVSAFVCVSVCMCGSVMAAGSWPPVVARVSTSVKESLTVAITLMLSDLWPCGSHLHHVKFPLQEHNARCSRLNVPSTSYDVIWRLRSLYGMGAALPINCYQGRSLMDNTGTASRRSCSMQTHLLGGNSSTPNPTPDSAFPVFRPPAQPSSPAPLPPPSPSLAAFIQLNLFLMIMWPAGAPYLRLPLSSLPCPRLPLPSPALLPHLPRPSPAASLPSLCPFFLPAMSWPLSFASLRLPLRLCHFLLV